MLVLKQDEVDDIAVAYIIESGTTSLLPQGPTDVKQGLAKFEVDDRTGTGSANYSFRTKYRNILNVVPITELLL